MISRRELLQKGATAAAGTLALTRVPLASARGPSVDGMNVVLFISDQERAIQHFPRDWARRNLPGLARLQRHGLTFENAFCSACMCSPTRATMMTGYVPARHGVQYTLESDMHPDKYPQVELSHRFKNMASVMRAAGYNVVYNGKWHLSKPVGEEWSPSDLGKYGFTRWNPPTPVPIRASRRRRRGVVRPTTTAATWTARATSPPARRACSSTSTRWRPSNSRSS